ncbi:class I histocompatibility antigen, Gogo-A*0201 alpha chain-like [Peromyscus maniculatus bairdii]|uniref:class I histocompatibility antigen, Gogo-A*0201 alpha chain-like n=1 Tax=Peromyscus maniculatus bairdii TaxID=230844 RepID=UPI00077D97A6|nr:class I histocompatibility antigen, Gogo-A*0201 alpha chain-like [Peromyscus maniculatus bairdii]
MKTLIPQALLLLLLVTLALTKHPKGSYQLCHFQTLLTWPGLVESQFISASYVDDTQFMGFNSRAETQRMVHQAPWMDQQKPEYWEDQTQSIMREKTFFKEVMKKVLHIHNQSMAGHHTIQRRYGCIVLPGGYFSRGFHELTFSGHDYIALNEDLRTWTLSGKAAKMLRGEWERTGFAQVVKTYLKDECVELLLAQLDYGKETLLRTDTPKILVTQKVRTDGKIILRCWALDFYPAEITLIWQRDGNNQTQDMEMMDTRPAGDGTFQKWAAVVVPSGEEQRYTCHVTHEGLPEPITLRWEPPQPSVPIMPIVTGLVLGAVLMGAVVTFLIWKRRTKG